MVDGDDVPNDKEDAYGEYMRKKMAKASGSDYFDPHKKHKLADHITRVTYSPGQEDSDAR